jgi:uncharacterized glyoxalase superfamily protein PhnB
MRCKKAMKNNDIIGSAPLFIVKDLALALDYYCEILGFTRPQLWGEPPVFAMPSRDGFIVMLQQTEENRPISTNFSQSANWDAYFWVRDAESLFTEFKAKGVNIEYAPCIQPYEIKEFAVKDVDGHLLVFGQHWPAS